MDGAPDRLRGTIRTLREGYGFISSPGTRDHFFHKSDLNAGKAAFGTLAVGVAVEFSPAHDPSQRPRAEAIDVLS